MSKRAKIIAYIHILVSLCLPIITTHADVPDRYFANYNIQEEWDNVLQTFVEIEAKNNIGEQVPSETFRTLHNHFTIVFDRFPKDHSYNIVYEKCLLLSNDLATAYNYNKFVSFMDNCYTPFSNIIKEINSTYTVKATATANPQQGSAPLTVTFDARASTDPSNQTIPADNYFRYYRDINGEDTVIGEGPVVKHTFDEPGNYIVHLTVRSSNSETAGVLDGSAMLSIDVAPKAAEINIYANGKKLEQTKNTKIGVQEAERGVVFDATSTIPKGGRQILRHRRDIRGRNNFSFTEEDTGSPDIVKIPLPGIGEFEVILTTYDNETNQTQESFRLIVADPVALIKQSPENGSTSATFSFDANGSYSETSSIRLYTWEIFDQAGNKLNTFQGKSIKKQFAQPGAYTVKLTVEDEVGQTNIATRQIFVESTEPLPQFSMEPVMEREYPSEFIFDASLSSDIDADNGFDDLRYQWKFSDTDNVEIVETSANNEQARVRFNKIGTYTITLTVSDNYGKISDIEKELAIESTLRPELFINPTATVRGDVVNFVVRSNESIINYQRDFGDDDTRTVQTNRISHVYQTVDTYNVHLRVTGPNGQHNALSRNVFIGEKQSPIVAYSVINSNDTVMTQNATCTSIVDQQSVEHPAYRVTRYQDITIDISDSVNTKGTSQGLAAYFQPRNDEIYKQSQFNHRFADLGCQYVDVIIEDTSLAKNSTERVRFQVVNGLPTLDNIVLSFPQFGNELGVGFTQNNVKDIFNSNFDPLIVKVSAQNSRDPDGQVSYYKRYYYYKDDPSRLLETKITPANIPYTFFSLPRTPGEFVFGVTMYDNDDGKQASEEVIGMGPIVFFPPDVTRPDIPLVTLKTDKVNTEVGEEVTFDVVSKIISDRPDFIQERTIQYDFDGDGTYDMTTKKDRVTHIYTTPNEDGYTPRAAVIYRGYKGVGRGSSITVKNGLKPRLLFNSFGTLTIFRDISIGDIAKKEMCLSIKNCDTQDYKITDPDTKALAFDYPENEKYFLSLRIEDDHANAATKRRPLTLTAQNLIEPFHILSIPDVTINQSGKNEIFVGKNLDNSVLYYIKYNNPGNDKTCYIDTNIAIDSNGDGTKDNDQDFLCNALHLQAYEPSYDSIIGKIYYDQDGQMTSEQFTVSFIDFAVELDQDMKEIYERLRTFIQNYNADTTAKEDLQGLLIELRDGLIDQLDSASTVVAISDYIKTHENVLTLQQQEQLNTILEPLRTQEVSAAEGDSEYEQAKKEILLLLPHNLKTDIQKLFTTFENTQGQVNTEEPLTQQEHRKSLLQQIVATIGAKVAASSDNVGDDQVDPVDMDVIIMPNICQIANFYSIPTQNCSSDELQPVPEEDTETTSGGLPGWLQTLLRILGILIVGFIGVVVVFAIKARKRKQAEAEEEI